MTKQTSSRKKSIAKKRKILATSVVVGIIGFSATIIAALINGYFGYLNTRTEIILPTLLAQTLQSPTDSMPTPTATSFQPSPTSTFDWTKNIKIKDGTSCPTLAFPDYLFTGSEKVSWLEENGKSYYFGHKEFELLYAPPQDKEENMQTEFFISLFVTNISNDPDWIMLDKDVDISISYLGSPPSVANLLVMAACGGGGLTRQFSEVPLRSDFSNYSVKAVSTGVDYYTLQQGESEVFDMHFDCQSPGVYQVHFNIPVIYKGEPETISYSGVSWFMCPQKLIHYTGFSTIDTTTMEIIEAKEYEWTGDEFKEINP